MKEPGVISGISVSHSMASVDEIESARGASESAVVSALLTDEAVSEAFVLQTCNRAEAYVVTDEVSTGRAALSSFAEGIRSGAIEQFDHEESIEQLMRVAAGLDSLVLGEDQILGQLRSAYENARSVGGIGPMLEEAVTKAIHVGERARTETAINEGTVSIGSAAATLAGETTDLTGATALLIGAGEMGSLAARALDETPLSELVIANRTRDRAEHLAADVDVDARGTSLDAISIEAPRADLIVAATSAADYLLTPEHLDGAGETVCLDLGQPRDVDPGVGDLDQTELYDIDDLESVTQDARTQREAAAVEVEAIIDAELTRLLDALKRRQADEAISTMYKAAELVKSRELEQATTKLETHGDLTREQHEILESFADAIIGQLLAAPTRSLRDAASDDDWSTIQTALQLFDPEFDGSVDASSLPESVDVGSGSGLGSGLPDGQTDSSSETPSEN